MCVLTHNSTMIKGKQEVEPKKSQETVLVAELKSRIIKLK